MKTKYFILAAIAAVGLASCADDAFIAEAPPVNNVDEGMAPIAFSSLKTNFTRAGNDFTGAEAADLLGGQFVVFGYKGSKTAEPQAGKTVFDNYLVKYIENSANTTESNTRNWEYVLPNEADKIPIKHAVDNGIVSQTIKYWDYSANQYDFIAWSTGKKTAIYEMPSTNVIPTGSVLVSEIAATSATTSGDDPVKYLENAYTFQGKAVDLKDCYIADLVTVKKGNSTDGYNYGQPVTLKFRQLGTKVRIGFYETVPGYSVKNVKFYPKAGVLTSADEVTTTPTIFTAANQIFTEGTYTVYFPTVDKAGDADNNVAHITFAGSGDQDTKVEWGTAPYNVLNYTFREKGEKTETAVYLGRTSNTASFAGNPADNYYVVYLPNEVGTNLNLRVDYTLENIDGGGEIIEVKNASAQVPLIYTQWKPGYAYTYLFKISDKSNGKTGPWDPTKNEDDPYNADPAGLFPITFDAVVVNADEDATQETITTISTPSITSYQKGSAVVNNDEYTTGNNIFVTVNENDAIVALSASNAKLYTLENLATEAEVIDAISFQDDVVETGATITGRSGLSLTEVTSVSFVSEIEYGPDGNKIKNLGTGKAMSFAPASSTNYAFVYETVPGTTTSKYQRVTKTVGEAVGANVYRYALKTAHDASASNHDVKKGVTYFDTDDGTQDAITAFPGQIVSNLYLDAAGTQQASGNAVTGTTYYYTVNNGLTYLQAHNLAYADFASATLYKDYACTETFTPAEKANGPVNGTAYYWKDANEVTYFCVIEPQQTNSLYVIDDDEDNVVPASGNAVTGMIYLDKYTFNNGTRYVKVIKVE